MAPDWARRSRCWRRVSGDEDTIAAVGEPIKGLRNTAQWAADLDNPANRKFVEDFKKTYKRMPTLYASQGYDAAMLLDSAVRQTGGKLDADTLRPRCAAPISSRCAAISSSTATSIPSRTTTCGSSRQARTASRRTSSRARC